MILMLHNLRKSSWIIGAYPPFAGAIEMDVRAIRFYAALWAQTGFPMVSILAEPGITWHAICYKTMHEML
jgi:hypothetical protein